MEQKESERSLRAGKRSKRKLFITVCKLNKSCTLHLNRNHLLLLDFCISNSYLKHRSANEHSKREQQPLHIERTSNLDEFPIEQHNKHLMTQILLKKSNISRNL